MLLIIYKYATCYDFRAYLRKALNFAIYRAITDFFVDATKSSFLTYMIYSITIPLKKIKISVALLAKATYIYKKIRQKLNNFRTFKGKVYGF